MALLRSQFNDWCAQWSFSTMTGPNLQCLLALHNLWHYFYSFLNSTSAAVLLDLGFLQNLSVSLRPALSQRAIEYLGTDFWDLHLYGFSQKSFSANSSYPSVLISTSSAQWDWCFSLGLHNPEPHWRKCP